MQKPVKTRLDGKTLYLTCCSEFKPLRCLCCLLNTLISLDVEKLDEIILKHRDTYILTGKQAKTLLDLAKRVKRCFKLLEKIRQNPELADKLKKLLPENPFLALTLLERVSREVRGFKTKRVLARVKKLVENSLLVKEYGKLYDKLGHELVNIVFKPKVLFSKTPLLHSLAKGSLLEEREVTGGYLLRFYSGSPEPICEVVPPSVRYGVEDVVKRLTLILMKRRESDPLTVTLDRLIGYRIETAKELLGTILKGRLSEDKLEHLAFECAIESTRYRRIFPLLVEDSGVEEVYGSYGEWMYIDDSVHGRCKLALVLDEELLSQLKSLALANPYVSLDEVNPTVKVELKSKWFRARFNIDVYPVVERETVDIRVLRTKQLSLPDLIKNNTLSSELAAYLLLLYLNGANILITGGTGSGKSLSGEQPVLVVKDGFRQLVEVEKLFSEGKKRLLLFNGGFVEVAIPRGNLHTFSLKMPELTSGPVKYVIRHKAPTLLYRVETVSGREVEVTGDHSLLAVTPSGKLKPVKASELSRGHYLVAFYKLPDRQGVGKQALASFLRKNGVEVKRIDGEYLARTDDGNLIPLSRLMREKFALLLASYSIDGAKWVKRSYSTLSSLLPKFKAKRGRLIPDVFWLMPFKWRKRFLEYLVSRRGVKHREGVLLFVKGKETVRELLYAFSTIHVFTTVKRVRRGVYVVKVFFTGKHSLHPDLPIPVQFIRTYFKDEGVESLLENKVHVTTLSTLSRKLREVDPGRVCFRRLWAFIESGIFLDKVKKVETFRSEDSFVFDLEVPGFETFYGGDGVVLHNTTLANALLCFTPPYRRILSVEDTREVADLSKVGKHHVAYLSTPSTKEKEIVNCLHRNPDVLFIGELLTRRDVELMLFAAQSGVQTIATTHSLSVNSLLSKWRRWGVEKEDLGALHLIVLMGKMRERNVVKRRVVEVYEVNEDGELTRVFSWSPKELLAKRMASLEELAVKGCIARLTKLKPISSSEFKEKIEKLAEFLTKFKGGYYECAKVNLEDFL